jgi:transcriptional regulator with XRE-family HTH domain
MNDRNPQTNPAAFLGAELRRARNGAGITQDQLAGRLGYDRSVIAKAETGERPPSPDVAAALDDAFPHLDGLISRLAVLARSADGPVPAWFEDWLEAERTASMLRIWQPIIIPGLLQTAGYARALFVAGQDDTSEDFIDALVTARLDRQAIFGRPKPPHTVIVLDEPVLRRLIGSPQIMHDQLTHVAEVSRRPNMVIQVVPSAGGANAGLGGALNIASADGAADVLLTEAVEDQTTERRTLVRKAGLVFDRVRGDALPRAASRDLISRVAEEWKQ